MSDLGSQKEKNVYLYSKIRYQRQKTEYDCGWSGDQHCIIQFKKSLSHTLHNEIHHFWCILDVHHKLLMPLLRIFWRFDEIVRVVETLAVDDVAE